MVYYSVENYKEDLKLCNAMIKRYFFKYQKEFEDLRQIGLIAQFRGRECYRNAQKTKLSTYLWSCTYLAMFDYLRRNNFKSEKLNVVSLNDSISLEDEKRTLEDVIQDTYNFDDVDDNMVILDTIKKYFKSIPDKKSNSYKISKYTVLGYSSKEIMDKLGVSVSYINRVKQEFLAKLKIMLKKELHDYDR